MQYKALYRKYRPTAFDDVVGQKAITKTLKNAIKENKLSHAYLFAGPRGSGKTSVAKILAKAINCLDLKNGEACGKCEICLQIEKGTVSDIIEIDAASNNGVDEIREIKSKVNLLPGLCKFKVYIVDEVHMLTTGAFNALLKTLEEPPKHVIFIFATTEPHKLPSTIISRCQRFDFKKISNVCAENRLIEIAKKEKIEIEEEAVKLIAKISDGGLRDAVGLLDQMTLYSSDADIISAEDVAEVVGLVSKQDITEMAYNILNKEIDLFLKKLDSHSANGKDLIKLVEEIMLYIKDLVIYLKAPEYFQNSNVKATEEYENFKNIEIKQTYELIMVLNELLGKMHNSNNPKLLLEINIINYININDIQINNEVEILKPVIEKQDEQPKEKTVVEVTKNLKNKKILIVDKTKIPELVRVRVNNVFVNPKKEILEDVKQKWIAIREYSIDKELGVAAGMLLDAKAEVASSNHLVISVPYSAIADKLNCMLREVDKVVNKITGRNYKVIALADQECERQKEEYKKKIKNGGKYIELIEPIDYLIEVENVESPNQTSNEIAEMFGDIIEMK